MDRVDRTKTVGNYFRPKSPPWWGLNNEENDMNKGLDITKGNGAVIMVLNTVGIISRELQDQRERGALKQESCLAILPAVAALVVAIESEMRVNNALHDIGQVVKRHAQELKGALDNE